jgi:hypothetical protein
MFALRLTTSRMLEGCCPMITVIADAKYAKMFRVQLDDGTTSDMLNQDRAQELARLWAVTPPVRRKPVRASFGTCAGGRIHGLPAMPGGGIYGQPAHHPDRHAVAPTGRPQGL